MAKEFDISVLLRVMDQATAPLKRVSKQFEAMGGPVKRLGDRFKAIAQRMDGVAKKMRDVGRSLMLRVTAPLLLIGGLATKASISFETAFTGVRKTVEATEEEFATLKKGLMDLAREIPLSTQEFFRMGEIAGQLGVQAKDIVKFTKVIADLAATTDIVGDEGAMSLARFSKVTGMSIENVDRLGSSISYLGNSLAATESEILGMALRLAGAGKLVGLSEAQIVGLAGALKELGIETQAGGTAFSMVMRRIDKEIGTSSDKMQGFAWVAGQSIGEFEKLWKKDAKEALLKFVEGLGRVRKEGINVNQVLDALGMEGIRISDALLRASGSGDSVRKAMKGSTQAYKENIATIKEANLRYATTASRLTITKNKAIQMAVAYGNILKPILIKITKLLEPLVDWLAKLGPTTKIVLVALAGIAALIPPILIGLSFLPLALKGIGVSLAFISANFLPITIAVAALAASAYLVIKHWTKVKTFFVDLLGWLRFEWEVIEKYIGKVIERILEALPDIAKKGLGIGVSKKALAAGEVTPKKTPALKEPAEKSLLEQAKEFIWERVKSTLELLDDPAAFEKWMKEEGGKFKPKPEKTSILEGGETSINLKVSLDERLILAGYEKKGRAKVNFIGESYLGNTLGTMPT